MSMRAWTFVIKEILNFLFYPAIDIEFSTLFFIRLRSIFKIDFLS